ncbi:hypothetical protein J4229_03450 [Candidatus Pacearchaeota archaeon]|nr:hypothetical protein [Candidatus Pacearchaeota archaeon]
MKKIKKGQTKIQEMAFVLIAIVIFFSMVALVYFSIRLSSLKGDAETQREQSTKEIIRKLSDIPEFSWADCSGCIDMDKVFVLKGKSSYNNFWALDYLAIEKIYPNRTKSECTNANYPECTTIILINKTGSYGSPTGAFVSLCGYYKEYGGIRCELGKIYASAKEIQ